MIKRSKPIFSSLLEILKLPYKEKILMSVSGRSRASAHELQLIDGGDFQKKMLVK